ncbi:MAG: IS1 family transposase [Nitrososphaerota archaeon]|nr:IS1 family transposase [Nitrososphaerota archaeon]
MWYVINYGDGVVVVCVLGFRGCDTLGEFLGLLGLLDVEIAMVYFGDDYVYYEVVSRNVLRTGRRKMQKIECKYLTFRTRLKRLVCRTICYFKSLSMHRIVFGLLINMLEFNYQPF